MTPGQQRLRRRQGSGLWPAAVALLLLSAVPAAAEIRLEGVVASRANEPLPGARLRLLPVVDDLERGRLELAGRLEPEPVAEARTDGGGGFVVTASEPGMWRLRVEAPGFVPLELALVPLLGDVYLPTARLDVAEEVEVRVADGDRRPVAGARVRAWPANQWRDLTAGWPAWAPTARAGFTDVDGIVRLPRARDERLTVRAFAPGHGEAESVLFRGRVARLSLPEAVRLPLEVVDESGAPAAGVLVGLGEAGWAAGWTDERGRGEVWRPSSPLTLSVQGDRRRAHVEYLPRLTAPVDPLRLTLPSTRRTAGRVVDAGTRQPIAGALVWLLAEPSAVVRCDAAGRYALDLRGDEQLGVQGAAPGYLVTRFLSSLGTARGPTVALPPAAAVRGVVVDADGAPVEAADVQAFAAPLGRTRQSVTLGGRHQASRARTDAAGRFRFGDLQPEMPHELVASAGGRGVGRLRVGGVAPHDTLAGQRIVLLAGGRIGGRLVDRHGRPVPGAEVEARPGTAGERPRFFRPPLEIALSVSGRSDGEGRFAVGPLAAGRYDLLVAAAGFAPTELPGVELADGAPSRELGDVELEPGATVAGRVLDPDGTPLAGVEMRAEEVDPQSGFFSSRELSEPDAWTAGDGWFEIGGLRAGRPVEVRAWTEGRSSERLPGVVPPTDEPLELVLHPTSTVAGRVVDPDGRGLAGVRLAVTLVVQQGVRAITTQLAAEGQAVTDADGLFRLEEIDPGTITLTASQPGWTPGELQDLEVPRGEDVEGVELVMRPAAAIEGTVRGPDGEPLSGVGVEIQRDAGHRSRYWWGAFSDGDGYYRMDQVEPGPRSVVARDDTGQRVVRDVEVAAGTNRVDLEFEGGVEVSGRVTAEGGQPVAGASVWLRRSGSWQLRAATSSADGSFALERVRDGAHTLNVEATGFARWQTDEPLEVAGSPVAGIEVRLERGGAVAGRILGLESHELARLLVRARGPQQGRAVGEVAHDGSYRVPHLVPGAWTVTAELTGGGRRAEAQVVVEPGVPETPLDLEFGGGLELTGQVLSGAEGLAGLLVYLEGLDVAARGESATDREGRFRVADLKAGRYRLEVADHATGMRHREELELTDDRWVVVEITFGGVGGWVLDARDASPLPGAVVSLRPAGAGDSSAPLYFPPGTTTDAAGAFALRRVAAGDYLLIARRDGYATEELALSVRPEKSVDDLELELEPTRGLLLDLRDAAGEPVEALRYAVLDGAGGRVTGGWAAAGERGRFRLDGVPRGQFELLLAAASGAITSVAVNVPGPPVAVRLGPACRLEISIPELAEDDLVATVSLTGADGRPYRSPDWTGEVSDRWPMTRGHREFYRLPAGAWSVQVTAPDGRAWQATAQLAPDRTTRLDLR